MSRNEEDRRLMEAAIEQAREASAGGDVPVGAVLAIDGHPVAWGQNRVERDRDPLVHAEIVAVRTACRMLETKWLTAATLYVTLEPCAMCAGAIVLARLARVVFGAQDPKSGAMQTLYTIGTDGLLNHRVDVTGGVLAETCGALLTEFFRGRRGR